MLAGQSYAPSPGFGQLASYGSPGNAKAANFEVPFGRVRRRMNVVAVCLCLLMPSAIFMAVFGILSFHVHFAHPGLCWFMVVMALIATAVCGLVALQTARRRKADGNVREPTWLIFLFMSCLLAWVLAVPLGLWNYRSCMLPHYNLVTLNTYNNVDPGAVSGSGVMDAGRLSFKAGSYIDTTKAIGFKKVDTYCVAPVTSTNTTLATYDFWATGVNCCSGQPGDFHCGETGGKLELGGGNRVLSDAEIPWLTLATQQAEAFYHLKVGHAIFFKNVADPLGEESAQMDAGVKFFCLWSLLFFGIQLFLVLMTLVVFSRAYA